MSAFVIKVKTDNTGTSNSDQFTLPGSSSYSYNFDVDWGDGSPVETINSGSSWTHTFAGGAGTYSVEITENVAGGFPTIYFNNGGDKSKLLEIEQWGTNRWDSLSRSFLGCSNVDITATDHATANTGSATNFSLCFHSCSSLTTLPLIDTSSGTNFALICYNCTALTDVAAINTANATTLRQAFYNCSSLTTFPQISTANCQDFYQTWRDCSALTSFPLIDTSSGTNFFQTWLRCSSLTTCPTLDFTSMSIGTQAFFGVTLDTASYDAILANSFTNNVNNSVTFHGGNSKYGRNGLAVRDTLTSSPRNWTITDGGYDSVYDPLGGVKGWWCPSLDTAGNGTTTLTDLSGNGNNGTLTNMDAATDWVADTDSGGVRALDLDGGDDYVEIADTVALRFTTSFSLSAWVKLSNPQASFASILSKYQGGANNRSYALLASYGQQRPALLYMDNGSTFNANNHVESSIGYSSGAWTHIVARYDAGSSVADIWVDGIKVGTDTSFTSPVATSTEPVRIGTNIDANTYLDGLVDNIGAWNRVLSDSEVTQLYNGGRSLQLVDLSTGLQGWWCPSLDTAGNGTTTLTDLSGNGNNLTITSPNIANTWVTDTDNGGVRATDWGQANDYAMRSNVAWVSNNAPYTVSLWWRTSGTGVENLFSATGAFTTGQMVYLRQSNAKLIVGHFGGGGYDYGIDGVVAADNVWRHLAVVYDGDVEKLYINGSLVATTNINDLLWTGNVKIDLGRSYSNTFPSVAVTDGLALYSRVLTADEVTQLYNGGRSLNLLASGTTQSIVPQLLMRRRRLSGGLVI